MIQRLRELRLKNFRQFGDLTAIDLDADVVLIHGQNASGKSSLLHAVELALTQEVADLSRFEGSYPQCLTRRGSTSGAEVSLTFLDADGVERKQVASLAAGGKGSRVTGSGPLQAGHVQSFRDRCYLSQARLSRLLELYLTTEPKRNEPPLIQFIRELLNVDALDRLEEGLEFLGNIVTTRKTVPALGALQRQIDAAESAAATLQHDLSQRRESAFAAAQRCRQLVTERPELDQSSETLWTREAIERRRQALETQSLATDEDRCGALRAALEGMRRLHTEITEAGLPPEEHSQEFHNKVTQLAGLRDSLLEPLTAQLASAAEALTSVGETVSIDLSASAIEFAWEQCSTIVGATLKRLNADVAAHDEAEGRRQELHESLQKLDAEWEALSQRLIRDQSSTRSLLEALQVLIDQIVGETCPLCDRDFAETGHLSLREHLAGKLVAVQQEHSLLQSIVALRTQRESGQRQLESQTVIVRQAAETRTRAELKAAVLQPSSERFAQLAESFQQLREVLSQERESRSQRVAADTGVERRAAWRRRLSEIEELAGIVASPSNLPLAAQIVSSGKAIRAASDAANDVLQRSQQYVAALQLALDEAAALSKVEHRDRQSGATRKGLDAALMDVKKSIEAGKEVRKQAAAIAADVFNQVFNEQLNRLWRDLFERLAPNEMFHPQLTPPTVSRNKITTEMGAAVAGKIEFTDIGAIFSTGNLNSAALSLFLALNLVEAAQHRLLILDDPVQNMDDLHATHLAALLKGIARDRQHGRQLLVATHDRSLFEFWQKELGPAQRGESLITISLERSAGAAQSVVAVERFEWSQDCVTFRNAEG